MQSAKGKTKRWLVDWDVLQGAGRWENPLMGWASSADYMQGTQLAFPSKEEAIAFVSMFSAGRCAWVKTAGCRVVRGSLAGGGVGRGRDKSARWVPGMGDWGKGL